MKFVEATRVSQELCRIICKLNFLARFYATKFDVCSFALSRSAIFTATTLMSEEFTAAEVKSRLASHAIVLTLTMPSYRMTRLTIVFIHYHADESLWRIFQAINHIIFSEPPTCV